MTLHLVAAIGLGTATGAFAAYLILRTLRGRRPRLGELLLLGGSAYMALAFHLRAAAGAHSLDWFVGFVAVSLGVALTVVDYEREKR